MTRGDSCVLKYEVSEFHLPHAHQAFRQKHLDQRLTLSVNDQAHV